MALKRALVSNGLSVHQAESVLGISYRGLLPVTATGTTRADALAVPDAVVNVGTTTAGTGILLPVMEVGDEVIVRNGGANALLVYPALATEVINALGAGAGYSVAAGGRAMVKKIGDLLYMTFLSA